ncbi:NADH-quinone oxidoreductase subunit NuoE [Nitrospira defluvii]|nr:NADH-quinone oxidoreductase subunit NuoE [Nitrospira defluvii]
MKLKALSSEAKSKIEAQFPKYPDKRSVILAALRIAQEEIGYVSEPAMIDISEILELTPVQVYDVATFYTQYNMRPVGKYLIQVCKTLSCALVGSESIVDHLKKTLGIGVGETTGDGLFTIKLVECLAACGSAPMMQVNNRYYEKLTHDKVDQILKDLKRDGKSELATGSFMLPVLQG